MARACSNAGETAAPVRIGVLGGSFDPVHLGHTALAAAALEEGALTHLIVMPAHIQPFKIGREVAADEHRLAMCRLAFEPLAQTGRVMVSDYEMEKKGISYTYDTLTALRAQYPAARLFFITGTDAFMDIASWRKGQELLEEYGFIVSVRPGFQTGALGERIETYKKKYGTDVILLRAAMPEISSTAVKARVAQGLDAGTLLPPAVEAYIHAKGLYR